jgi:hypothetical protein
MHKNKINLQLHSHVQAWYVSYKSQTANYGTLTLPPVVFPGSTPEGGMLPGNVLHPFMSVILHPCMHTC